MAHTAELIAVGTELLLGNTLNSNAQMLSQSLSMLGINVYWHTVVGDNESRLRGALETAQKRADVIITTGGLGPTYDDMTKQTICRHFSKPLILRDDILTHIRTFYESTLHRTMPANNAQQAEFPADAVVFPNSVGTAPGCAFEAGGVHVVMLPGPPHECRAVWESGAIPYLSNLSDAVMVSHDIMVFGLGESLVEQKLHDQMIEMTNPTLATYAKPTEVRLRATAKAHSKQEAETMLAPVVQNVCDTLGSYAYGVDVTGLPAVCKQLLQEQELSFSTAESCTGGLIAKQITDMIGCSAVFRGGVVSYWSSVKADVLNVPQELLDQYGAVSEPVARAMAEGTVRITGSDIGVSVTGVAGPAKDDRDNPVGLVYVGLATPDGTFCRKLELGNRSRSFIRDLTANHAFDFLRRYLTGTLKETCETQSDDV